MSASLYRGALVKVSSGGTNRDRQSGEVSSHSHCPTIHNVTDHVFNAGITDGPRDALYQLQFVNIAEPYEQEAQLSPRDPRDDVYQLKGCCTHNAHRSRVSLSSTFSNCHVLFGYLHSFVHASLQ